MAKALAVRRAKRPQYLVEWLKRITTVPPGTFTRDQLVACAKIAYYAYSIGRRGWRNNLVRGRRATESAPGDASAGGG